MIPPISRYGYVIPIGSEVVHYRAGGERSCPGRGGKGTVTVRSCDAADQMEAEAIPLPQRRGLSLPAVEHRMTPLYPRCRGKDGLAYRGAALARRSVDVNVSKEKSEEKSKVKKSQEANNFTERSRLRTHTKRKPALLRYAPGGLIPGHTDYVPRVTLAKAKAKPTR